MDSIENISFTQSNMDEGDVTNDQIRCTPMKKLTLRERGEITDSPVVFPDDSKKGEADQDRKDRILGSLVRKRKPSVAENISNSRIINRMLSRATPAEQNEATTGFQKTLEVLYKLAISEKQAIKQISHESLLSGVSTACDETFVRESYTTLINPKQRLFTMCSMAVDTPLPDGATELFISNLSNSIDESVLVPILEAFGTLINLRIPMDTRTGKNKGFAFAIFLTLEGAKAACSKLDQASLFGKTLLAKITKPKKRLFIGNLPKSRTLEELQHHFKAFLPGFKQAVLPPVITILKVSSSGIPQSSTNLASKGNQGFCFLEFYGSKEASLAKKVISTRKVFGTDLFVDWAEGDEIEQQQPLSRNRSNYFSFNANN